MTNLTTEDQGAIYKLKPRSFNKSFSAPISLPVCQSLLSGSAITIKYPLFSEVVVRVTGVEDSRRFLRELDKAPGGNNLHYILQCLRVLVLITRV